MSEKKVLELKFKGIDSWSRPVFKGSDGRYYGSTDILFHCGAPASEVLSKLTPKDIVYFGSEFDCEPYGSSVDKKIVFIDKKEEV
jgi:hypothetical protein